MLRKIAFALLLWLSFSTNGFAQTNAVPGLLNFQGRLATPSGNPVPNGNYSIRFRLYDDPTVGSVKFEQTLASVAVKNGTFAVTLSGVTTAIFAGNLWLEIKVGSDAALTPRQQLATVPYAFKADSIKDGGVNFSNIAGTVTGSQIALGTITAANLNVSLQGSLGLISTTSAPTLVTGITTNSAPDCIALSGNYAYVTTQFGNTFQIIDITTPTAPILRSTTATGTTPVCIAVSGTRAAIVNYSSNTLQIFDVTSPTAPILRSTTTTGSGPNGVAINGNFAYVTNVFSNSFQVFDISSPTAPILRSTTATDFGPVSVGVSGTTVYVLNRFSNSLQIFDVTSPTVPVLRSTTATGSSPYILTVSGSNVYLVNENDNTFQIFNVATPTAPVLRSTTPTDQRPRAIGVVGSNVYVGNFDSNTLQVFDATNLNAPVLRGTAQTGTNPYSVAGTGNYILVAALGTDMVQVFQNTSTPNGIAVSGNLQVSGMGSFGGNLNTNGNLFVKGTGVFRGNISTDSSFFVSGYSFLSGPVGINNYNPQYQLDVGGDINASGNVRANGVILSSDARYKIHVAGLTDPLEMLLALRGVTYDWDRAKWAGKNFPEGRQTGFIAQEMEKIFPELVSTDANGYKSVNYIGVIPVLVEAVKSQQKQHQADKAEIADLKARLNRLENLVESKLQQK